MRRQKRNKQSGGYQKEKQWQAGCIGLHAARTAAVPAENPKLQDNPGAVTDQKNCLPDMPLRE